MPTKQALRAAKFAAHFCSRLTPQQMQQLAVPHKED
jgi:hypothetical protein